MTTDPTMMNDAIDAYIAGRSIEHLRDDHQQISAFVAELVELQAEHHSPQRAVRLDYWQRFGRAVSEALPEAEKHRSVR